MTCFSVKKFRHQKVWPTFYNSEVVVRRCSVKHLCWSLSFIVFFCNFIEKESPALLFSCEFYKIS